jgi:hypothetical protein
VKHQVSLQAGDTIQAKRLFESMAASCGARIKGYHADNVPIYSNEFKQELTSKKQTITLSGTGAHHQNGVAERAIRTVTSWARTTRIPRVSGMSCIARELTTSYNPAPLASTSLTLSVASEDSASTSPSEEAELAFEDCCAPREMAFAAGLPEITVYPQTLCAALNTPHHPDWWKAVCTEFENCENKQVWTIVKKSNLPKGRKIISNRWVFARKDDGRYQARTVAKDFAKFQVKIFKKSCPCHQ